MVKSNRKIARWDGTNKRKTRSRKLTLVRQAISQKFIPRRPKLLTFAGSKAHFERGVVGRDLTVPENITTIQTCRKIGSHDGSWVLKKLLKTRDEDLPGMRVWPSDFKEFCSGYNPGRVYIPSFTSTGNKAPRWFRSPKFRNEMLSFVDRPAGPFHVLDIDMCGVFSETNGSNISKLMNSGALAKRGILFINHQKGRDGRGGKLFSFLEQYFSECEYFDIDAVVDDDGDALDLDSEDEVSWWIVRYRLVPIFYTIEAFRAGYSLEVEKLIEYRDKNPYSRAGVNMLQWYFNFEKLKSVRALEADKMEDFASHFKEERSRLKQQLASIEEESYPYSELID